MTVNVNRRRLTQNAGNVHLHFGPAHIEFCDKLPLQSVPRAFLRVTFR